MKDESTHVHSNVSSNAGVSMLHAVRQLCGMCQCVCVSVKCACGAPSINQVGPRPAAERGLRWATHPAGRSGEIQCPECINALQMSLQLSETEGENVRL